MRIRKIALSMAAVSVLAMPSAIVAEEMTDVEEPVSTLEALDMDNWPFEVSGEVIGTYGVFTSDGVTNNPQRYDDNSPVEHVAGEPYRAELTAKLFLNGEIGEESSWHSELQFNKDWEGVKGYENTRLYSQFDWLRELYVDTYTGDLQWRLGKQQVVWGKADGVKFLDIINPTDFRHWGQDSMEDSRIPLWMITAEYPVGDEGALQFVYVPQVNVTNQIPGLYDPETGDAGQPFVPLGMDTMLGGYNGFKNIGPQMGMVAGAFTQGFNQLLPNFAGAEGNPNILQGFGGVTVAQFTSFDGQDGRPDVNAFLNGTNALFGSGYVDGSIPAGVTGNMMLSGITNNQPTDPNMPGVGSTTNMMGASLNTAQPTTMFDYMGDTSFATFDTFVGMKTKYVRDHENNDLVNGNIGLRYSGATDGGLNYTFNYYYHYDNNPVIDVDWEGANGEALTAQANTQAFDQNGLPVGAPGAGDQAYETTTMSLQKSDGTAYNYAVDGPATMVFVETQNKINTLGMSFDYAIDNDFAPVIVRGEFVYDHDVKQPVVDLGKLAYGDIDGAFKNEKADFFNYVIGLDVTVLTNLFVSFQFMDKWNLDYQDSTNQYAGNSRSYERFTANSASMSMGNGFRKAEEHQIMYTLFLSKPFLESDVLRVNNLFLLENEDGGFWNRFDFEYTWSDDILLSAAWNQYGGDKYGVFGQFEDMSNVQGSVKFIF